MPVEEDGAAVRRNDLVDETDEGGLACTVGTEETEDCAAADVEVHPVEGTEGAEALSDIFDG